MTNLPIQKITNALTESKGVELFVFRLDLNSEFISGNKLYKLKFNLEAAKAQNKKTILTFGGAFSNHIAATAAAANQNNFKAIGIIRGEVPKDSNPTLEFAKAQGMDLDFVSRTLYQNKSALNDYVLKKYKNLNPFIIPEGGSNEEGIRGCTEIVAQIPIDFDLVCCPCGTGATIAGIIQAITANQFAIGFQVLKADRYIFKEVNNWLKHFDYSASNWEINEDYHFGGYAKLKPELVKFILDFEKEQSIPLDFVYTGKMLFGILDLISKDKFKKGAKIVAIHTGGLQCNKGFEN